MVCCGAESRSVQTTLPASATPQQALHFLRAIASRALSREVSDDVELLLGAEECAGDDDAASRSLRSPSTLQEAWSGAMVRHPLRRARSSPPRPPPPPPPSPHPPAGPA